MKVIFVCTDKISPVIHSQVIETVQELREQGTDVELLFLLPPKSYKKATTSLKDLDNSNIPYQIKILPLQKTLIGRSISLIYFSLLALKNRKSNVILHCRGLRASRFAVTAKSFFPMFSIIYDVRGDYLVEREFHAATMRELHWIKKEEAFTLKSSDFILFVSEHLKNTLTERYKELPSSKDVIACTAKKEKTVFDLNGRELIRKKYNLENKLVFIYSGSIGKWHCFDKIIALCETISLCYENVAFLFLTRQESEASILVGKSSVSEKSHVHQVHPSDIGDYLSASDVAIILRENHPLNASSSPVKIAEYILNGLPVIMTNAINDYSKMIEKSMIGLVLDSEEINDLASIKKKFEALSTKEWIMQRNRYEENEVFLLTKEHQVKKLKSIYENMQK